MSRHTIKTSLIAPVGYGYSQVIDFTIVKIDIGGQISAISLNETNYFTPLSFVTEIKAKFVPSFIN